MSALTNETARTPGDAHVLRAVLCGSYRRDVHELRRAHDDLVRDYLLLSPAGLDFVDPDDQFVRLAHELDDSVADIEQRHLDAITSADFVWLHVPDGYVGSSTALEVGHARALGVPVLASTAPADPTLASFVTVVDGPAAAAAVLQATPGRGLRGLQQYYGRTAARRGWAGESPQDTMLLMTEELGELARAVRKSAGLSRDGQWPSSPVGHELADVQLYLVHLANVMGVDLADAVSDKERVNAARFAARSADAA